MFVPGNTLLSSKRVKTIVIGIPAIVAVLLVSVVAAFFLISEDVLTGWLVQSIETRADADITFESIQLERGLTTRIDVEQLEVVAHDESYKVDSSSLSLSIRLPQLLLARLDFPALEIGDTRVHIQGGSEDDTRDWRGIDLDALRLRPVLHEVSLANLSVSAEGSQWTLPSRSTVSELSLQLTPDKDVPELSANIEVVDEKLQIIATLPDFHQSIGKQRLPFNIRINRPFAIANLQGDFDFSKADSHIKATLDVQVDELGKVSTTGALQIPGSLKVTAAIDGTFDKLSAESISGQWQAGDAGEAELSGRIDNLIGMEGIALALKAHARNANWLQQHLPESMEVIKEATLSLSLNGTDDHLVTDDVQLKVQTADELDIDLSGGFGLVKSESASYDLRNIQARLNFKSPTTRAARALLFEEIPEFGAVQASTDINSDQGHPTFSNVSVNTVHPLGIKASLGGVIDSFPLDPDSPNKGYDLDVAIQSPEAKPVLDVLDLDMPLQGPFDIAFKIQGDTPALQLNAIRLKAGSQQALQITADGKMLFGDWSRDDPLESLDITLDAYSHTTQAIASLFHEEWPTLGALKMHARVHTLAGKHRIDDYSLRTVEGASVQVAMTGNAADLTVFPALFTDGMQLTLVVQGADTADLNKLLGLNGKFIPTVGAFKVESEITGSDATVIVKNVRARAGSKDILQVTANGHLGKLDRQTGWSFYDTDLKLTADSLSSQALAGTWGYNLPPFGPLRGTAEIHPVGKGIGLRKLLLRVGADSSDPVLIAQGKVGDLYQLKDVDIDVKLNVDGHNLAAFADQHSLKDLAPISGELHVADKNGLLGIQTLQLVSDHPDLNIDVNGRYPDIYKPETLQLKADIRARDLALVGALFDQQWPDYGPLTIQGNVGRENNRVQLSTNIRAGKKGLDADLHGDFTVDPPSLAGKLTVHHLSLPDFYEKAAEARKEREKDKKKLAEPVFSKDPIAFDYLKKFDLALAVNVATFDPTDSEAVSAESTIRVKSGVLTLRPTVIRYPKGALDLDLSIDARQMPRLEFKASGDHLNPWLGLQAQPNKDKPAFDAELKADISLSAQGQSPHQLASSLNGSLYVTITNGKLRRSFTDLLFVDIVGWTATHLTDRKYLEMRCGVADFTAAQGVIKTNGFFIDTKNIAITGDGLIDLGKEEIDYVFLPKKKSRIILKAEPVKVTGSLRDPSVTAVPVKSAALTFGTLIFAPYVFAGMTASQYLQGKVDSKDEDTPCLLYEKKRPVPNPVGEAYPEND